MATKLTCKAAAIFSLILVLLCSCSSKAPHWDAETATYHIPAEGVDIVMPGNVDWTVAAAENLPGEIAFAAIDETRGIVAMLMMRPGGAAHDAWSLPGYEIDQIISEITRQEATGVEVSYGKADTAKEIYDSHLKAVRFEAPVRLGDEEMVYTGYILAEKGNVLCIFALSAAGAGAEGKRVALEAVSGLKL